jgi:hypothetical protein
MERMYSIHEIESHVQEIADQVANGEEILIELDNDIVIHVNKIERRVGKINVGAAKGLLPEWTDEEWQELDEAVQAMFLEEKPWEQEL